MTARHFPLRPLALALILLATITAAGRYQFRHYDMGAGLSQNTVFAIAQPRMGFM